MKKLFCFIGRPGCGKSTLLRTLQVHYFDIFSYIQPYCDEGGGLGKEGNALKAYEKLFSNLAKEVKREVFVELGTNYPEVVVKKILGLQRKAVLFLCNASPEICLQRSQQRERRIATERLQQRLYRVFPERHLELLKHLEICYELLDMEQDLGKSLQEVREIIES